MNFGKIVVRLAKAIKHNKEKDNPFLHLQVSLPCEQQSGRHTADLRTKC